MTRLLLALAMLVSFSSMASAGEKLDLFFVRNPSCGANGGGPCFSEVRKARLSMRTSTDPANQGFRAKLSIRGARIGGLPANTEVLFALAFSVVGSGCEVFGPVVLDVVDGDLNYYFTGATYPYPITTPGVRLALCSAAGYPPGDPIPNLEGTLGTAVMDSGLKEFLLLPGLNIPLF